MPGQFELLRGGVLLGLVTIDAAEYDFPWTVGWLEPSAEYATAEPLFIQWAQLLDTREKDNLWDDEEFDKAETLLYERIMGPGIRMRSVPGGEISEVVGITIEGRRVSWRE